MLAIKVRPKCSTASLRATIIQICRFPWILRFPGSLVS